jgi:hypothetical protein
MKTQQPIFLPTVYCILSPVSFPLSPRLRVIACAPQVNSEKSKGEMFQWLTIKRERSARIRPVAVRRRTTATIAVRTARALATSRRLIAIAVIQSAQATFNADGVARFSHPI